MGRDEKRRALDRQKSGFSAITYNPARILTLDTINAQPRMFEAGPETPISTLERRVKNLSRSQDECESNLEVVRLLRSEVKARRFNAYQVDEFNGFHTRAGETASYWAKAVLVDENGQILIPCADYRRTFRLTALAKKFAASVMNFAIREQNPTEFGEARLAVFQFPLPQHATTRIVTLDVLPNETLYTRDELAAMIAETFSMWDEVLEERTERARKRG